MRILKGGIAFFDSGIGGLTVLAECRKWLPNEIFYYFGDNNHAPYGNLAENKIEKYTMRAFKQIEKQKPKAVVVACNTATAVCIEKLRKKYKFPIIGTEPALNLAAKEEEGDIFVLMTSATCNSLRLKNRFPHDDKVYENINIRFCACEHLAAAIESHILDKNYNYASFLPLGNPSAVVLGCTHYIYIKQFIQNFYDCKCYDGNEGIAKRLQSELERLDALKNKKMSKPWINFSFFRDERPPDRDERPPLKKRSLFLNFIVSKFVFFLKRKNTLKMNKCSYNYRIASKIKVENKRDSRIFFLGKAKSYNAKIYEQMFVFY